MSLVAPPHFLIIRFSSMGDIVLQTSLVKWLKQVHGPNARISFVTSVEFLPLLAGHPEIAEVITFDRRGGETLLTLAKKIRRLHARTPLTMILDVHATLRSWKLRWLLPDFPGLVVDKRRIERFFLTVLPGPKRWASWKIWGLEAQVVRVVRDWSALLLGNTQNLGVTQLTSTPAVEPCSHSRPYVVLAPVASFASKHWPIEYYLKLARLFLNRPEWGQFDLVVVAGPEDHACQAFHSVNDPRLINLQGKTSLRQSIAWVQGALAVVGNDSGMNHIAEAGGVPVITLFGPTHEAFGFRPHLPNSRALSLGLWCSPCSTTGARKCYRDGRPCMTQLTPEFVLQSLIPILEQRA